MVAPAAPSRRSWAPCGVLLALLLAALLAGPGCSRKKPSAPPAATAPAGVVPEEYLQGPEPAPPLQPVLGPQAPRPTGPLPPGTACVSPQCHAALAVTKYVHQPVAKKACDACHQADIGEHRYPLKRSAQAICNYCHSVDTTALHRHAALDEGCLVCHNPHGSATKFLLKADSVERTCTGCHLIPFKRYVHGPVLQGECTLCHQPHQSDFPKLLRNGEGRDFCFQCHTDIRQTVETATDVHKPVQDKGCLVCHNPHTSSQPRLLTAPLSEQCLSCHPKTAQTIRQAKVHHAALAGPRQCAGCHNPHASPKPLLLADRMDRVCLQCHDRPQKAPDGRELADLRPALESKYLHGPVKNGSCSACHDTHGSQEPGLLTAPFPRTFYAPFQPGMYDLCFLCHQQRMVTVEQTANLTNFRDGLRNLHFVHVDRQQKGRTCRTCHAVHGSNLPHHMASEVPFAGSKWPLEIGFEPTATGGRCATTCHKTAQYSRDTIPPAQPSGGRGGTHSPATKPDTSVQSVDTKPDKGP